MRHADPHIPLDFDAWRRLAEHDPDGYESMRWRTIAAHIERAPAARRQRLRRLQWRIDTARARAGTPLAATVRISDMMWESLFELDRALRDGARRPSRPLARVLPFRASQPR